MSVVIILWLSGFRGGKGQNAMTSHIKKKTAPLTMNIVKAIYRKCGLNVFEQAHGHLCKFNKWMSAVLLNKWALWTCPVTPHPYPGFDWLWWMHRLNSRSSRVLTPVSDCSSCHMTHKMDLCSSRHKPAEKSTELKTIYFCQVLAKAIILIIIIIMQALNLLLQTWPPAPIPQNAKCDRPYK